jgi:cytochrome c
MNNMVTRKLFALVSAWWMLSVLASALLSPDGIVAASAATGDATSGKALFEKRCTGCHSLDKNKEGPRLRGVYLRHAGSVPDFPYSDELKATKITWDDATLDKWLTNPDIMVPDNDMAFHVSNPQERADIIQFLRLSSGK